MLRQKLRDAFRGRIGFRIQEHLVGSHRYARDVAVPSGEPIAAGTELPFSFTARWGHPQLLAYLNPLAGDFMTAVVDGTITAGGLCDAAPIRGTVELRYVRDATVRYVFDFTAQGQLYRYQGQKRELRPWNLHRTHLTCYGTITEVAAGNHVSDAVASMTLLELPRMLGTFRLE